MAFTPKDWKDLPEVTTPLSAAALEDMETRLAAYTDTVMAAEVATRAAGDTSTASTAATNLASTNSTLTGLINTEATNRSTADAGILGAWRLIRELRGAIYGGQAISTQVLTAQASGNITPATTSQYVANFAWYFDPADHLISGYTHKLRLKGHFINNGNAQTATISFWIAPVATWVSAVSGYSFTAGSAVTGTTVNLNTTGVATNAAATPVSVDFDASALTAGWYVIMDTATAILAGSNTTLVQAQMFSRHV
jgi:hypothetical protein